VSAEPSPRSRTSLPPPSRLASGAPAAITSELCSVEPPIVLVTAAGRLTLPVIQSSRDFGNVVRALGGKPYRVLCDFTQTITMPEDVCAVFMRGQEFAVERGMERDAFVCTSSVLRLQFVRIARESGRFERLGPLHFFDTIEQGRAHLEAPASEIHEVTSRRLAEHAHAAASRRGLVPEAASGPMSRRAPAFDTGEVAMSRRAPAFDTGEAAVSRRAPAIDLGGRAPSRHPPPFSLRAAAPSRQRNRG